MQSLKTQFLAWIQFKNLRQVRTGEITKALALTTKQEWDLLNRLSKQGLIVRLKRGLYMVPQKIPPGGKWQPNEFEIVARLMEEEKAKYQIGGPTAFHFHGLDEQIPNQVYIYNNKISGERKIGGITFRFMKVPQKRLGGTKEMIGDGKTKVFITSLPRTLLDAVYDWDRYNTLPRAYDWIRNQKRDKKVMKELIEMTLRYGNISAQRRIGYCLEKMGLPSNWIRKLKKELSQTSSPIPWIPSLSKKGKIDNEWGLVING